MAYNRIETKPKICKGCGKLKHIWARGYCKPCDPGKESKKDHYYDKDREYHLNVFFADQATIVPNNCENCGERLSKSNPKMLRFYTAHILPKSKFESVEVNPDNIMFLGTFCGCHGNWDNKNAEARKKMPCYSIALERYDKFYNQLSGPEQVQAEKYLGL